LAKSGADFTDVGAVGANALVELSPVTPNSLDQ
jgi:hypothetical protein